MAKSTIRYKEPGKEPWPKGELSFTRLRVKPKMSKAGGRLSPRDFWVVKETGDWSVDNRVGEILASELMEAMRASRDPNLLGQCVADMIEHGHFGGIECGFLYAFSWWAIQGARASGETRQASS